MTEFISRKYGNEGYEVIIKTDNHEHYKASENFARQLIDHAKPVTDNNDGCKWIPVSERLPENDGFVLAYTIDQIVGEAILVNRKEFYWAGSDDDAEPIAVTHWMPLPEPPKEDVKKLWQTDSRR